MQSSRYEQLHEEIHASIQGVNRYNPNNIDLLEQYIQLMVKEGKYDKDTLLTTLKLYQLNPQRYNEAIVCCILLKTMMVLPRSDYALAKYMIDPNRAASAELRRVTGIGSLLESCNFSAFWRLLKGESPAGDEPTTEGGEDGEESEENTGVKATKMLSAEAKQRLIDPIAGFEDAVRVYACQVITVTFQRIEKAQLVRLLGGVSDSMLAGYAKLNGWESRPDGTYFITNHEATIKSRNIEEKLKFEDCAEVVKHVK